MTNMPPESQRGLVVKSQSGFFTVRAEDGREWVSQLRGRMKHGKHKTDLAAIGDRVIYSLLEDGTAIIEEVTPRERVLSRRISSGQKHVEQVIVANPDQAVFVFACAQPEPHLRMLDRFLVAAERASLPAVVCANKTDLVDSSEAERIFGIYRPLGYPVLFTSTRSGAGIDDLRSLLHGKLTVFSGPSGVGKSSLLNAIQPGLALRVQTISDAHQEGRHTTVAPELVALVGGGFMADTPGLRAIAFWDIAPEEIDAYFPEIRPWVSQCTFNDCVHENTPGCAVQRAMEQGAISPERYRSFLHLRRGET
jgi:ribosome biogenesis GTPase / thiamine phosphate phosphatase